MENTLVLETKSFALRLYQLLKELDPMRWQNTRKETLKSTILNLETDVQRLYQEMEALAPDLKDKAPTEFPVSAFSAQLRQVGELLSELKDIDIDNQLSYFALYGLRKKLQKAYQGLCQFMNAYHEPIPNIRPTNYTRSIVHFGSGMSILALIVNTSSDFLVLLSLSFMAFCWISEGLKRFHPKAKAIVMAVFAKIAHPHEYDKVNSATWYGVALFSLALMYSPVLGALGVGILGAADPAAAMIGRKYGKIALPGNRTLEGSSTFFIVGLITACLILTFLYPVGGFGATLAIAAGASFTGAIGELFGAFPDDNLTIPIFSAGGAYAVMVMLGLA